jgi:acetyl esterase/lipase
MDSATGARVEWLWPQGAPGAVGTRASDKPSLLWYPAPRRAGDGAAPAVVICPGGAYGILALRKEGVEPALWLNRLGVCAFVLRYRLGPVYHHPVELGDARRALRWVRAHARRFGVDPGRVGMLGFSAGGHLAALASILPDIPRDGPDSVERFSGVPDFQMLIYPVISMAAPYTHRASRANLLGKSPDAALLDSLSAEKHAGPGAPPAFLVHAEADPIVAFANSRAYAEALRKAGVPVEFLAFNQGGHAFGLAQEADGQPGQAQLAAWPGECEKWMRESGLLPKAGGKE